MDVNGVKADAAGTIYLDSTGKVGGSVSSLRFEVAGMGVEASNITLDGATLRAGTAALRMPSGLGGASVTVYGLAVGPTGVKIGGGDFTLPEIKLGGFALALRGSFKVEGTTTIISAYGSFKMPILASNASAPGCSGIEITAEYPGHLDESDGDRHRPGHCRGPAQPEQRLSLQSGAVGRL